MIHLFLAFTSGVLLVALFAKKRSADPSLMSRLRHDADRQEPEAETAEENLTAPKDVDISEVSRVFRIGDMHFSRGDFEEAEKWFIKTLALDSQHTEAHNLLGVIYIQQKNPRRAEILYRKLFSITQKEPAYYCNYGRCLYNQGRLDEAIEAYENAIKLDCTKAGRYVSVGQIYYEKKDFVSALEHFVKALELDPLNTEYLKLTAQLAELAGDSERQHTSLKKLGELEPYNREVQEKLSRS